MSDEGKKRDKSKEEIVSFLVNWLIPYIKNKDIMQKSILEIKNSKDTIYVKYSNRKAFFIAIPIAEKFSDAIERAKSENPAIASGNAELTISVFNTKGNLDSLISEWKELSKMRNLKILFINPESELDTKWIICPHVHSLICDEKSVGRGLKSMFEMVDSLTESQIEKMSGKK
ncbi:MAG: hypothetical protein NTV63_03405 [Candidatus Woesearchaeota archaeon]|nr:hypothetical protein [Candidatus Woesearchaeota archaeon]